MIISLIFIILIHAIILFTLSLILVEIYSDFKSSYFGSPNVKNDPIVMYNGLKLAGLSSNDVFADLGSGNGQVLFAAVDYFKVKKAYGFEIGPGPYYRTLARIYFSRKYSGKVLVSNDSFFDDNLERFDVIYLYLLPDLIKKLTPKLQKLKEIKPDVRIVSCVFELKDLKPKKTLEIYHKTFKKEVKVYLY